MKRYLVVTALITCLCCSCRQNPTVSNSALNPVTNNPSRGTNELAMGTNDLAISNAAWNYSPDWITPGTNPTITHILRVSNYLSFPPLVWVVCVDSNQWRILTNAYPTNFYQREIQFEK